MTDWYSEMASGGKQADGSGGGAKDWYSEMTLPKQEPRQSVRDDGRKTMDVLVKEKLPEGFSLTEMGKNIIPSTGKVISDTASAVMSPIETAKNIGNLASGFLDKGAEALTQALPEGAVTAINKFNNALVDIGIPLDKLPEDPKEMTFDDVQYANAAINFYKDRYGSIDDFLYTLQEDPAGVVSDAAGILMAGGTVAPKLGKVGVAIDPLNLAARGTVKAVTNIPKVNKAAQSLYQSAAKFGTTLDPKQRQRMTQTALDNEIMPRSAGVDKVHDMINGLNTQIDDLINDATLSGGKVPRHVIYKYMNQVRNNIGRMDIKGKNNRQKIDKMIVEFEQHLDDIGKKELTATDLQELKKSIYKEANYNIRNQKSTRAGEEAQKAMARAAKEEIEKLVPEVKQLNADEGALIELQDELKKVAARIENRDLVGIGLPIKGGLGAAVAGPEGAAYALGAGILDIPSVKAKLAIILNKVMKMDISEGRKTAIADQISKIESLGEPVINAEENNPANDTGDKP